MKPVYQNQTYSEFIHDIKEYAERWHYNLKYGKYPYLYHLEAVASVLNRFGIYSRSVIAAAYLHDVLEDTECKYDDIVKKYDETVASIVDACTDGEGHNRRERKEKPYRLIPVTQDSIKVKLADRIANVESCIINNNEPLFLMYRKEHKIFRQRLYKEKECDNMWNYLDSILIVKSHIWDLR